jgi:curli biogenesis system outer membrane secretion channel CsgG
LRRTIRSAILLLLGGCAFGFAGGGLPPNIRTVAVNPFDNTTSYPTLGQDVSLAVKQAVESRLGLRSVPEQSADAIVTGKVTRYDADQPLAYVGTPTAAGQPNQVNVTRRQVELAVDITIVDQRSGKILWDGRGQVVQGQYDPGREADGRKLALQNLVNKVIDGVHSNW